jgi:hypothetical protein
MNLRTGGLVGRGHLLAASCFVVLAVMRVLDGALLWGLVFVVAAATQAYLGVRRGADSRSGSTGGGRRSWRILALSATALTAWLLFVQPALGIVAATIALYCARAARRAHPTDVRSLRPPSLRPNNGRPA